MRKTKAVISEISTGYWHIQCQAFSKTKEIEIYIVGASKCVYDKIKEAPRLLTWQGMVPSFLAEAVYYFGKKLHDAFVNRGAPLPDYIFLTVHEALSGSVYLYYTLPNGESGEVRNSGHWRQVDAETWRRFWRQVKKNK